MRGRQGVTAIEVIIAMSIFSIVMAAVLQSLVSVRSLTNTEVATDDLTLEGQRVLRTVVNDMGNSAWWIPAIQNKDDLLDATKDRAARYYPYIMVQSPGGVPTALHLRDWARSGATKVQTWASWFSQLPPEHRMQSQEIVFLKVQRSAPVSAPVASSDRVNYNRRWDGQALTDTVSATPGSGGNGDGFVDWRDGVLQMNAFRNGIKVSSLTLRKDAETSTFVGDTPLVHETYTGSPALSVDPATLPPEGPNRFNPDYLREFAYVVLPLSATGKCQLVRCWRNGSSVMPVYPPAAQTANAGYDVISENVDRVIFDTYRTLSSLNVNQVRVRIYLSKESVEANSARFTTSRVECTTALRSTVDPEYSLNLGTWLGPAGTVHSNLDTEKAGGVP